MMIPDAEERLARLANEPDPLRKKLVALGILTRELAPYRIEPVLVGGSAVEFYTAGGYASKDVDLAMPSSEHVDAVFAGLGFRKEGRYWSREDLDLLFEAPAGSLAGEDAPRKVVNIEDLKVVILGIEDLLLDRLRAWVHWESVEDGRWARRLALLHAESINWTYVREKTSSSSEEQAALASLEKELKK